MMKKVFIILMAAILIIPCASFAKKKSAEIPMNERLKFAVEVTDATNFEELNTAEILRDKLISKLNEKEIFNILNPTDENFLAEITTLEKVGAADVGDMVTFPTKNLEIDREKYKNLGVEYVINCEILGVGFTTESDKDFGLGSGIGIGIGTGGGIGIGVSDSAALRKLYCTAVNMQIVEVESGAVVARQNLVGQALKHRKPRKGYENATDEAYLKSLDDAAKIITKRVVTFAAKNFDNYSKVKG